MEAEGEGESGVEREENKGLGFVGLGGSHGDFGGVGKESRMRGNKTLCVKILRLFSEDIESICPRKIFIMFLLKSFARTLRGHSILVILLSLNQYCEEILCNIHMNYLQRHISSLCLH